MNQFISFMTGTKPLKALQKKNVYLKVLWNKLKEHPFVEGYVERKFSLLKF